MRPSQALETARAEVTRNGCVVTAPRNLDFPAGVGLVDLQMDSIAQARTMEQIAVAGRALVKLGLDPADAELLTVDAIAEGVLSAPGVLARVLWIGDGRDHSAELAGVWPAEAQA